MNTSNRRIQNVWIIALALAVFLFVSIRSLIYGGWLSDEIFYVRFLDPWFAGHFWSFLLQFQQYSFPPRSPIFGNPPLAMLFMTLATSIGSVLHMSELVSSRAVNLLFGVISLLLIYAIAKKTSSQDSLTPIFALFLCSCYPAFIVINTTAYLDALSIALTLGFFYSLVVAIDFQDEKFLWASSVLFGLSLITKYQSIFVLVPILVYFYPHLKKFFVPRYRFFLYIGLAYVVANIWAGVRDPAQIQQVFSSVTGLFGSEGNVGGLFADYTNVAGSSLNTSFYYFLQLLGKTPLILLFGTLLAGVLYMAGTRRENYYLRLFAILLIINPLLFGILGGLPNTIHRVSLSFPFLILTASVGLEYLHRRFRKWVSRVLFTVVVLALSFAPLALVQAQFYNSYTNSLNPLFNPNGDLYRNGDGEGLSIIADWLRAHGQGGGTDLVGIPRFFYVFSEYSLGLNSYDFPLNQGCTYALSNGISQLIIHSSSITGGLLPPILSENCLNKEFVVYSESQPVATLYKVLPPTVGLVPIQLYHSQFQIKTKNSQGSLTAEGGGNRFALLYGLNGGDWVLASGGVKPGPSDSGLFVTVTSATSSAANLYIDLAAENGSYLRQKIDLDFSGKRTFYIYFSEMTALPSGEVPLTVASMKTLRMSLDSPVKTSGSVVIEDLSFFSDQ